VDDETRKMMTDFITVLAALRDQVEMTSRKLSILIDVVGALRSEFNRGAWPTEDT
jgi:hypothetical protein